MSRFSLHRSVLALAAGAMLGSLTALPVRAQGFDFVPPGDGAPSRSTGGASRTSGQCLADDAAISALVPRSTLGLTRQGRPSVVVRLPATDAETAFFSLKDSAGNLHYQGEISIPKGEDTWAIATLPADAPELAVGETYQWFFAVRCDGVLEPDSPTATHWIRRVAGPVAGASAAEVSFEGAIALAADGIWYDAVAAIAALRAADRVDPRLEEAWAELMAEAAPLE